MIWEMLRDIGLMSFVIGSIGLMVSKLCLRPKPTGRTSRLLSCHRSVGGLRLARPAQFFAKLRSDRRSAQAAVSVQTHCSRYVDSLAGRTCVMFAKWTEARTQELSLARPLPDR